MTEQGSRAVRLVWSNLAHRPLVMTLAVVMFLGSIAYPLDIILQNRQYSLSSEIEALVGDVNPNLASKLTFDQEENMYVFNGGAEKESVALGGGPDPAAALASMKQQTGGGAKQSDNLYSLDVPLDPKKGVTYYDKNLKLSFKATPQFTLSSAQTDEDGRIVFPAPRGMKAVYSLKSNGLKEDMVLTRPVGDSFSFSYKLDLPKELEARLHDDGSVGIYSADPVLFGNVTYGGDEDFEKLRSARETAVKDHLAFAIPAPVIVQAGGGSHEASAKFVLKDNILTVASDGLEQLTYPVSIDPTVVVTSSTDFQAGNNEGGIEFATDEIQRSGLTGGVNAAWASTTSFNTAREMHRSEAYNGYAYVIGGYNGTTPLTSVEYAPINANGTVGAWQTTSSFTNARSGMGAAAYNGYLYITGGYQGGGIVLNDVQYAKINANGTLGAWQTTSSFATARQQHTTVAYNGYLYVMGGASSSTVFYNDTQYAKINADGTVGAWQSTSSFTTTRTNHASEVYNGYIYVMGGANSGSLSSVEFARINDDGTVGAWVTTSSLAASRNNHSSAVYNGYLYVMAGYASSGSNYATVEYAPVNGNGTLGTWRTTGVNFTTARYNVGTFEYKGYLYIAGGYNDTTRFADVQYAKIQPAGMNGPGTATTSIPVIRDKGKDYGRYGHATVVYNGYIYVVGGYANVGVANVEYAPLNANGTIGTWAATTSLPAARYYHAATVYNGYLYVVGGYTTAHTNSVLYAPLNTNGTVGTWTTNSTTFTNARSSHGAVVNGDKLYVVGGYGTSFVEYSDVQYATINSNGSVGTFTTSTSFATARDSHYTAVVGKYLYVIGGWDGTTNFADVQFAELNPSGGLVGGLSSCPGGGTLTNGTWCTTSSLQTARHAHTGYAHKGCLYVVAGGIAGNTITASAEYACANTDGTLGAWSAATQPTSIQRNYASGAVHGDNMYLIGGESSGQPAYSDAYFSSINHGGSGMTGSWTSTSSFPNLTCGLDITASERNFHSSVVYNGYVYIIGGNNGCYLNDIRYAPINSDGTLGSWSNAITGLNSSFSTPRHLHASVAYNGYLYVLGGYDGNARLSDVQYAPINANGTLGTWSATTSLPYLLSGHAAVVHNGYMYILGGSSASALSSVRYAAINANGTIGSWVSTTNFTTARHGLASFVYNDYLYVLGGQSDTSSNLNDIQYAPISSDGTVGAWVYGERFNKGRYWYGAVAYNGYVYITGGAGGYDYELQYASIGADGSLSGWQHGGAIAPARYGHTSVAYGGNLYLLGGNNSGTLLDSVQYAPLRSIPRKATYSKLVDLGSIVTINSVTRNGTGMQSLIFRTAGSDGIFGANQPAGTAGGVSARYVWMSVGLDDTTAAVFSNGLEVRSIVTDITIDYNGAAAPSCTTDQRLRHGASFSSESLQALGTCTQ